MNIDSLIHSSQPESTCSQLFIQFPSYQPLWLVVKLIEEMGGNIMSIQIQDSDQQEFKICQLSILNDNVQDFVISLNENGMFDVQGIGRRFF